MNDLVSHSPVEVGAGIVGSVLLFHALGCTLWRSIFSRSGNDLALAEEPLLVLFFQQTLGIGAAMLCLLLLAALGLFTPGNLLFGAATLAVSPLILVGRHRRSVGGSARSARRLSAWEYAVLVCAAVMVVFQVWRFPGAWDDTSYHLPLARTILEQHRLAANEWLRFPYFPAFMQLLFAAGLSVDVLLAQWLATWPVVVTLLGLMGAARWLCGHAGWGVLAWGLYVISPALRHSLGFAYVDAALVLFCTGAVLAAAVSMASAERGTGEATKAALWLALAGLYAGCAAGIKLQGLVMAGFLAGGLALCAWIPPRGRLGQRLRQLVGYGAVCLLVGGFWYLRSYWLAGDPVHPAGGSVFGYYLWTPEDMALQVMEQATHGVPKQWKYFLTSLSHVRQPYLWVVLAWPVLLLAHPAYGRVWVLIGCVTWAGILFWFWVSQVDRYLLPVAPLGALLCLEMVRTALRWLGARAGHSFDVGRRVIAAASVVGAAGLAYEAIADFRVRPPLTVQRDQHAEIALLQTAASLGPQYGERVLNFGYENAFFYYPGQLMGDWVGKAAFPRMADCGDVCRLREPSATIQTMHALGARMLLVHSEKFPFDEAQYLSAMQLLAKNGPAYLFALR